MKDIKLILAGDASTIDLTSTVEDKNLYEQKALVNMVTVQGSDPIYSDRGTTMLIDSIRGKAYNRAGIIHMGNFAALDTISFIKSTDQDDIATEDFTIKDINVSAIAYNNNTNTLSLSVQLTYTDATTTEVIAVTPALG